MRQLLHEKSLARLTTIGQRFPNVFKTILSQNEELKTRLESAVRYVTWLSYIYGPVGGEQRSVVSVHDKPSSHPAEPDEQLFENNEKS